MAQNFDMFLNYYIDLIYIPKLVIVSNMHCFTELFKNLNAFTVLMTQIGTKFRYVFKLHRPDLHTEISQRIQHIFFTGLFKNLNRLTFTVFLMTQIGMKFWYVFKLHRTDLHTKVSHRVQHMFFYRTL